MEKQQRFFRKISGLSFLFFLLFVMLTGCGRLQNTAGVKTEIRQALPDAKVLDVEYGTRPDRKYRFKKYTIDNKGIVFTYENYQGQDTMFGTTTAFSENNYCEALFGFFKEDIDKIIAEYQVEMDVRGSYVWITNDISHMEEIDNGINAVQEIYAIIGDYIPET